MVVRFVDASVFVHAYLRPRRELKAHERSIKARAREIVARINRGETVATSTVHFAEIANLLEAWMPLQEAQTIQRGLLQRDNVDIWSTAKGDLVEAMSVGQETDVGATDALAVILMRRNGLKGIYSFDGDFDRFRPRLRTVR